MKNNLIVTLSLLFFSSSAFCQDSAYYRHQDSLKHSTPHSITFKNGGIIDSTHSLIVHHQNIFQIPTPPSNYRDTRLGSSSPLYNTYKKNDNGAGAVTTNPNKGGG